MNTNAKLKICNKWLGCTVILILASGIQLEATYGKYEWSVWIHIVLGIFLTVLSLCHIYFHYKLSNWFSRFAKNRNNATRILWWTFLLTVASGIAASLHWILDPTHSSLGGIHGKIGFLMVLASIIHIVKHKKNTQSPIR